MLISSPEEVISVIVVPFSSKKRISPWLAEVAPIEPEEKI